MILVERMRELAQGLASAQPGGWSAGQTASFQNTPYRPSLVPLLVDSAAVTELTPVVQAYLRALEGVLRRYLTDAEMRSWFGLGAAAEALICAEGAGRARVQVCRLDGYVDSGAEREADRGRLWILENNADAPAGTLFTPRVNAYVAAASGYRPRPVLPMEGSESAFLDLLLGEPGIGASGSDDSGSNQSGMGGSSARGWSVGDAAVGDSAARWSVRILQPAGASNRESMEIAAALRRRGADAEVIDPRQLSAGGQRFCHDGRPVDVIWNKINTVRWQQIIAENPELVDPWCVTLAAGGTRHVNGFAARYVAESKLCHAWLSSEDGRSGLPPDEQRAVAALVTPTVRARRDAAIPWLAAEPGAANLAGAATRHQRELVLKAPYDIRGDGVTVGRAVDPAQWAARLASVLGDGDAPGEDGVLQRYVAPTEAPVVTDRLAMMRSSLDWFVFNGRVVGLGSKAGVGHKVNLFQGGTKLAVFQEDPAAAPA